MAVFFAGDRFKPYSPAAWRGVAGRELSAATARASMLYGIESDIIADVAIEPLTGGRKPVIIRDRRHPSKDFIKRSQDREIKYAMRARKKLNPRIDRMRGGGGETRISEGA